jgi:tetratricopeptide (TPR) repeat protein
MTILLPLRTYGWTARLCAVARSEIPMNKWRFPRIKTTDLLTRLPNQTAGRRYRGLAYYGLGDLKSARASCETKPDFWFSQQCLSVIYDKLGRHADAEAELSKLKAVFGDAEAYQYATIYAQWGQRARALEWLGTAMLQRDPGLQFLKTDPLLDPLRKEPRFQAIERELNFPK